MKINTIPTATQLAKAIRARVAGPTPAPRNPHTGFWVIDAFAYGRSVYVVDNANSKSRLTRAEAADMLAR